MYLYKSLKSFRLLLNYYNLSPVIYTKNKVVVDISSDQVSLDFAIKI